ncbi:FkbM family methyltransferase [Salinispora pacifica]|uniref:FkbM family methyltransferase n=1 Tax=Salinispora pacifica TaxID=351187 RepID=UPI00067F2173|nr:FkbM family methyltransferase [Salinispora pacifica]
MHADSSDFPKANLELPDGRKIACVTESEALLLWDEMSAEGMYGSVAASLRPGDVVLDIGANIGLASLMFHHTVPDLRIFAFEPAPQTFVCLEENLRQHVPQSTAVRAAVSDRIGELEFTFYPNSPGNSSLFANRGADDETTRQFLRNSGIDEEYIDELLEDLHSGTSLTVHATTVSEIMRRYRIEEIDLLKIDVERAELSVLQGIEESHWPMIRRIAAEVHAENGRLEQITTLLRQHGFSTTVSQSPKLAGTVLYELIAHA